jgi:hypothetical protein
VPMKAGGELEDQELVRRCYVGEARSPGKRREADTGRRAEQQCRIMCGGDFFDELSEEAIATFAENPFSSMHLYPVAGVAARVGKDETAWSYRDAK